MGTDLMELYRLDKQKCIDSISSTSSDVLLAELDDTIQLDICGVGHSTWLIDMAKKKVIYDLIVGELRKRLQEE